MKRFVLAACLAGSVALGTTAAMANESVDLILNWVPGGDHSPIFYALDQGWYSKAGIDLNVQSGKGSGMAAQRVGAGADPIGISDISTAFVAKSKGADLVAVMAIYANSPFVFYWKKSSGIKGPKDFPGHTIGNPPGDAARVMWPAFAKVVGIPVNSVTFVNVSPAAKVPTLAAGRVDIISDFYNGHDLKLHTFGKDLGFVRWSSLGLNFYSNSFVVNGAYLKSHRKAVSAFVKVTQRAYAACVKDSKPCIDALLKHASGLKRTEMEEQWGRVKELMANKTTTTVALGAFDPAEMQQTYDLVKTYFKLEKPFDPKSAYTNAFLDKSVEMTPQ
jgi:NitT/TauT family transport system substrate-binding protein